MAEVTRFYDREQDGDGPVSGAIQLISISLDDVGNAETTVERVTLPAGMSFEITDIMFWADTITSTVPLTVGSSAAGGEVVASVNLATDTGALTIVEGTIGAGGMIDVRVVAAAGGAMESGCVSIYGHVLTPPTSLAYRA